MTSKESIENGKKLMNRDTPQSTWESSVNAFIKKWCYDHHHLLDTDENDGERLREIIRTEIEKAYTQGELDHDNFFRQRKDEWDRIAEERGRVEARTAFVSTAPSLGQVQQEARLAERTALREWVEENKEKCFDRECERIKHHTLDYEDLIDLLQD